MATTAKGAGPARKRGRPRRDESNATRNKYNAGGPVEELRGRLTNIVGVCETCHRPIHPVAPIAAEVGISPVALAKFMKGDAGVSMDTYNILSNFASAVENGEVTVPGADQEPTAEETVQAEAEATA